MYVYVYIYVCVCVCVCMNSCVCVCVNSYMNWVEYPGVPRLQMRGLKQWTGAFIT